VLRFEPGNLVPGCLELNLQVIHPAFGVHELSAQLVALALFVIDAELRLELHGLEPTDL
jgi:hypothetical protein